MLTDGSQDIQKRPPFALSNLQNMNTENEDNASFIKSSYNAYNDANFKSQSIDRPMDNFKFKKELGDPLMGRNMGFPNMKYLDPETHGPNVRENTLYKQFYNDTTNDLKKKREDYNDNGKDMANNTFFKLFGSSPQREAAGSKMQSEAI